MWKVLLGVSGSVALVLREKLERALAAEVGEVKTITTDMAETFDGYKLGDPIDHIELRKWASCLVVAPLSANTMAKMTYGLCDNLLTNVYRAWDFTKPVIVAPAMNTFMWDNPITHEQIQTLRQRGLIIVPPVAKRLACGDVGVGAMASVEDICWITKKNVDWYPPFGDFRNVVLPKGPGEFGYQRTDYRHTGVDLYCEEYDPIYAVEAGYVVHSGQFTGQEGYWEDTFAVMVQGKSGVVCYGELFPGCWPVGERIHKGQLIGCVKRVLKPGKERPDIPGHSLSMLHLELWEDGVKEFKDWDDLLIKDPTPYLEACTTG